MVNFTILSGGSDAFISTYLFNTVTAGLALTSKTTTNGSPSWITQHPLNHSMI